MAHYNDNNEDGTPVFAKEETLLRLGNDEELYNEILAVFFEELPGQFKSIKTHISSNENAMLENEFHSLKGASANVGAETLSVISGKMELSARDENWDIIKTFLPSLEVEYTRVLEYLKVFFPNS